MAVCKKCGREAENVFKLAELKTMVVRNGAKSVRYQAMGDMLEAAACDDCITDYVNLQLNPKRKLKKTIAAYCLFAAFGIVLVILNLGNFLGVDNAVPKIFGFVVAFVSILSCSREIKNIRERIARLQSQTDQQNRKILAVEMLSRYLPRKHNDADLTYIDIDRLMNDDLEKLAMDCNGSVTKLKKIRHYIRSNGAALKGDEGALPESV